MKTFNYELREDIVNVILACLDKVQIVGHEAEAIVMAKQIMRNPKIEKVEEQPEDVKNKK